MKVFFNGVKDKSFRAFRISKLKSSSMVRAPDPIGNSAKVKPNVPTKRTTDGEGAADADLGGIQKKSMSVFRLKNNSRHKKGKENSSKIWGKVPHPKSSGDPSEGFSRRKGKLEGEEGGSVV